MSEEIKEERIILFKKWAQEKKKEALSDIQTLDKLLFSQEIALKELRIESEDLYQAAVKVNLNK